MQINPSPPPPAAAAAQSPPRDSLQKPEAISIDQVVISKLEHSPLILAKHRSNDIINHEKSRPGLLLEQTRPKRTNLVVWCGAIFCLIFSLTLIFFGIATLIVYLAIKPRHPTFEITAANLNNIYFDSPEYFNGDFIFLANFTNPNRKIDLRFEYLDIGLYFSDRLMATQVVQPFSLRPRENSLNSVHFLSSLVYLPQVLALQLQKQVLENRVIYNIRGNIKVRANLGIFHFSYWLHPRCQIDSTSPPTGVLITTSCKRKM